MPTAKGIRQYCNLLAVSCCGHRRPLHSGAHLLRSGPLVLVWAVRCRSQPRAALRGPFLHRHRDWCCEFRSRPTKRRWAIGEENSPGVDANPSISVIETGAIAHETGSQGELAPNVQCGKLLARAASGRGPCGVETRAAEAREATPGATTLQGRGGSACQQDGSSGLVTLNEKVVVSK